jgi:hypothetical protein
LEILSTNREKTHKSERGRTEPCLTSKLGRHNQRPGTGTIGQGARQRGPRSKGGRISGQTARGWWRPRALRSPPSNQPAPRRPIPPPPDPIPSGHHAVALEHPSTLSRWKSGPHTVLPSRFLTGRQLGRGAGGLQRELGCRRLCGGHAAHCVDRIQAWEVWRDERDDQGSGECGVGGTVARGVFFHFLWTTKVVALGQVRRGETTVS